MYDLKLKMWLVRDDEFILSDGRARLLRRIRETRSISKVAKEMGMSYRHAWGILHRIAENAGGDIVESSRGGKKGGETFSSYNEEDPPWQDRTWQPQFESAAGSSTGLWAAEFALPLNVFNKNKTLASEIGFNIRRSGMAGEEGDVFGWDRAGGIGCTAGVVYSF